MSAVFPLGVAGLMRPDRPGAGRAVLVLDAALLTGLMLFVYVYSGTAVEPGEGASRADPRVWRSRAATALLSSLLVAVLFMIRQLSLLKAFEQSERARLVQQRSSEDRFTRGAVQGLAGAH